MILLNTVLCYISKEKKIVPQIIGIKLGTSWHLGSVMILNGPRMVARSHSWRELRYFPSHLRLRNAEVRMRYKKKVV